MTEQTPAATPKIHPERQRRVRTALRLFSITAWITGVLFLLLITRMVMQLSLIHI